MKNKLVSSITHNPKLDNCLRSWKDWWVQKFSCALGNHTTFNSLWRLCQIIMFVILTISASRTPVSWLLLCCEAVNAVFYKHFRIVRTINVTQNLTVVNRGGKGRKTLKFIHSFVPLGQVTSLTICYITEIWTSSFMCVCVCLCVRMLVHPCVRVYELFVFFWSAPLLSRILARARCTVQAYKRVVHTRTHTLR